ncbi:MAG TPA: flavodoxin domain-containing protein [Trueperaceae bacterium]
MDTAAGRAVVVYATLFGTTARVAELVAAELGALLGRAVTAIDLAALDLSGLPGHDLVVLGTSTWNFGELPPDLENRLPELEALDLRGTALALFGVGDQLGYPDTFLDAVGIAAERLERTGARLVGRWPAAGYAFAASLALRGDELLGLAIDEDNEPELTAARVVAWADLVVAEAGLAGAAPAEPLGMTRGAPGLPGAPSR